MRAARTPGRLCVVVCGNGLGHLKRALAVVSALLRRPVPPAVDLHVDEWQARFLQEEPAAARVLASPLVRLGSGGVGGGPTPRARRWGAAEYFPWLERLRREEALVEADTVLSDNLAGVLEVRPDAVLMGSFLWHDVLRGTGRMDREVADFEEELLRRARPPMLCVDDVAMPAVARLAEAVRLPWFCDAASERRPRSGPVRRVLLMGGATDAVAPALRELAGMLVEETDLAVSLPARLLDGAPGAHSRLRPFGFADDEYDAHDLVVGRPGVGTLTDCVRFGLPILCFGDEDDAEMRYNGERVEALGLGRRISLHDPRATARLLRESLTEEEYARWSAAAAARPCGGIEAAARFVDRRLEK